MKPQFAQVRGNTSVPLSAAVLPTACGSDTRSTHPFQASWPHRGQFFLAPRLARKSKRALPRVMALSERQPARFVASTPSSQPSGVRCSVATRSRATLPYAASVELGGLNRDGASSALLFSGGPQGADEEGLGQARCRLRLQQDSDEVLGPGSGGDKRRGLVPIHVGSCHLVRVLEAEARKLEYAPLNRQVIVATNRDYLGTRLNMDAHRSSVRGPDHRACRTTGTSKT